MFPSGLLSADTLSSTAEWGQRHDARCPIGAGRLAEGASRTETPHTWGRHAWRAPRVNARPRCSLVFTQPVPAIVCARSDDMLRQITRAYMPAHFFFVFCICSSTHRVSPERSKHPGGNVFIRAFDGLSGFLPCPFLRVRWGGNKTQSP